MMLVAKDDSGEYIQDINGTSHTIQKTTDKNDAMRLQILQEPIWQDFVIQKANEKKYWSVLQGGINLTAYTPDGAKWLIDWEHLDPNEYTGRIRMKNFNAPTAEAIWKIEMPDSRFEHEVVLKKLTQDDNGNYTEGDYVVQQSWDPRFQQWTDKQQEARVFIISKLKNGGYTLNYKNEALFFTHIGANNVMKAYAGNLSLWSLEKI